ncbi:MAG: metallophosphoesterase [Fastidiosipilaceae bacterium]
MSQKFPTALSTKIGRRSAITLGARVAPSATQVIIRILVLLLALAVIYVLTGLNSQHKIAPYTILSDKVDGAVRFALITDFHSNTYGDGQSELLRSLEEQNPDAVLIGGDLFDERKAHRPSFELIGELTRAYPCYYVTGNHDIWTLESDSLIRRLKEAGVNVLQGECQNFDVRGQTIAICGIDDPEAELYFAKPTAIEQQLETVARATRGGRYTILIAHRPEQIGRYLNHPFDLVVCGHAHGGQWIVPGLINGVYAPHQGLFPHYAGGRYDFDGATMIVSRGLDREMTRIPRLHNRPELVMIEINPGGGDNKKRDD